MDLSSYFRDILTSLKKASSSKTSRRFWRAPGIRGAIVRLPTRSLTRCDKGARAEARGLIFGGALAFKLGAASCLRASLAASGLTTKAVYRASTARSSLEITPMPFTSGDVDSSAMTFGERGTAAGRTRSCKTLGCRTAGFAILIEPTSWATRQAGRFRIVSLIHVD